VVAVAKRKFSEIVDMVEGHYKATYPLRDRMEQDHRLYRLEPYDAGDGYRSYTSNEPQVMADKIISWLTSAEMVVRIPFGGKERDQRDSDNQKERFLTGVIRAADDNLCMRMLPPLRDQLAWYVTLRGWYAGRALLIKDSNNKTKIDITPWDPLNTFWGEGPDGLDWACYRMRKSPAEVAKQYNLKSIGKDDEQSVLVYDFYDKEDNYVVTGDRILKRRTRHGYDGVPCFIGMVGSAPLVQSDETGSDAISDFGESVFKHNRENFENNNFMMSTMLELTARSRKQGLKVKSRDGTKTLEEDPYQEGSEISLGQGEEVEPLGMLEMAKESGAFMGLVSSEIQRGGLPYSIYGELQFQLSGYAINTLRQGIETVLSPRIQTLERAYTQIFNIISEQYASDRFKAVEVSGRDRDRMYFSEEIGPDVVKKGGNPEVSIMSQLPQDDMSKMTMAQIAREGPTPLLPDIFIRDMVLGLQDADQLDDVIKEQVAEKALPEAGLWTLLASLENRGRGDLAQFYYGELMRLMMEKVAVTQQAMASGFAGGPGGPPSPGGPPPGPPPGPPMGPEGGPPGLPPQVMPNAAMGVPPVPPQGPPVGMPPGSPRPGAVQNDEERMRRMGLVPPRG
jgi:hypothetical protein